ncbi:MAG: hypothetical protein A4E57_03387 [Syntrophorhabdaceae bacterium PtaU1.Bin034]|nr:MAG: hypothetical protein A4E57_03387 [Syntrophorhabdaceae bacterium PtaU1.Bin034]
MALLQATGYSRQRAKRVFEGESLRALPVEGATRAPIVADGAKRKNSPCSKLQGIHKLKENFTMERKL